MTVFFLITVFHSFLIYPALFYTELQKEIAKMTSHLRPSYQRDNQNLMEEMPNLNI